MELKTHASFLSTWFLVPLPGTFIYEFKWPLNHVCDTSLTHGPSAPAEFMSMVFQGGTVHLSSPVEPCAIPRTSEDSEMPPAPGTLQNSVRIV